MIRREFITLLGGAAATWPLAARAQQPVMALVGLLSSVQLDDRQVGAIRQGLKDGGYIEGRNVAIKNRSADARFDRLPALAADLVADRVAAIVALAPPAAVAARAATATIPIVFVVGADPVKLGLVSSFNRPGGNVTGVSFIVTALGAKRLETLRVLVPSATVVGFQRQLVPTITVIGALINPNYPDADLQRHELNDAAATIGQQVRLTEASSESEIEAAFASFANSRVDALIAMNDPFFQSVHNQITALAAHYALPAIYWDREFAAGGGLVSYGPSLTDAFRQAGIYVARILRGEKPGDLPVQQPTKFELVLNLKAAKALGLEVPATVLAIADEVIE